MKDIKQISKRLQRDLINKNLAKDIESHLVVFIHLKRERGLSSFKDIVQKEDPVRSENKVVYIFSVSGCPYAYLNKDDMEKDLNKLLLISI